MKIYGVYDIKEKEQCIMVGPLKEIINFFNLGIKETNSILRNTKLIENKYEMLYLFNE